MNRTHVKAAAQTAEQRVRIAVEQVKATEKKARAAKVGKHALTVGLAPH